MIKSILNNLKMVITTPLKKAISGFKKFTDTNILVAKFTQGLNKNVQESISQKPKSLKEYVSFKEYYISKKLVCVLILLSVALATFSVTVVIPKIVSLITEPEFVINSP